MPTNTLLIARIARWHRFREMSFDKNKPVPLCAICQKALEGSITLVVEDTNGTLREIHDGCFHLCRKKGG